MIRVAGMLGPVAGSARPALLNRLVLARADQRQQRLGAAFGLTDRAVVFVAAARCDGPRGARGVR